MNLPRFALAEPESLAAAMPPSEPSGNGAQKSDTRELADLLDVLLETLMRYVIFPSPAFAHAVTLWIAATHAQGAWQHATRLIVKSPEKRCGKSRLLDLIEATCHKPLVTVNASVAAIYRSIDPADPPTLIFDEADSIFGKKNVEGTEELRGLLNAGFQQNRPALRCVGPQQTPTEFATFAMAALAAIGDVIPDTVTDRAVTGTMRRRAPTERVAGYRHRRDAEPLRKLGEELGAVVRDHLDELEHSEPVMPVEDRAADTWEPLIAIADVAGGRWPSRARLAATTLTAEADAAAVEESLGMKLLTDIKIVFTNIGKAAISSEDLVAGLLALPESPWAHFGYTQNDLARRLRPYGVHPDRVRPDGDGKQVRGYKLEELDDAFARYLPPPEAADPASQAVTPSQVQVNPVTGSGSVTPQGVTGDLGVTGLTRDCDTETACDTPTEDLGAWSSDTYEPAP